MNPYLVLELDNNCNKEEIKNAYKKLALKYHPDKNPDNKDEAEIKFKEISEAYQLLYDDEKRRIYDLSGNINDNTYISPTELFEKIFEDVDPKIKDFIKDTYTSITNAVNKSETGNIVDVIENIDNKKDILINGAGLLKDYFTDIVMASNKQNTELEEKCLSINIINLKKYNNIVLPIEYFYFNKSYPIKIINDNNKTSYKFNLNTEFVNQELNINDSKINFKLLDKQGSNYKRTNSYDLTTSINIGIDDYFDGFQLYLPHFKEIIQTPILVQNDTNILRIKGYGLPIWSENKYGDLFITLKLINTKRLHNRPDTT